MLLQQKIPFKKEPKSEKDMLISLGSVKMFHANIKANLPSSVSVVSTPMDLEAISFERRRDDVDNNVQFMKNNFYDSVGVSGVCLIQIQKYGECEPGN